MTLDNSSSRLSGGLDGHVKVYSAHTFAVTHGLKYDAPVLCLALSPKNEELVVGTSDRILDAEACLEATSKVGAD